MQTSNLQIFKKYKSHQDGFSLIEILVALTLGALIFLAIPSSDNVQKHRDLKTAVEDLDRSVRFASNEAILRNTVVRLRISLDKEPVVYTVEYGPPGNLPLPEMPEKANLSMEEEKTKTEKSAALDRQFTKVEEFEDIKREVHPDITVIGVASSSQKTFMNDGEASIYFYPTGEKDAALVFFNTTEEFAYIEIEAFMSETNVHYEALKTEQRVAKIDDIVQTRVDEVYKEWMTK